MQFPRVRFLALPVLSFLMIMGISCKEKEYPLPVSDFTYILQNECNIPLNVQFKSLAENANIWRWDFGDGSTAVYSKDPVHEYLREGIYTVDLTVYSRGGTHSEKKLVYVVNAPDVDFQADNTTVTINDTVRFYGNSVSGVLPSAWLWNFGDGTTSTLQNPWHVYANAGLYNVTLTVVNACGSDYVEKSQYIRVNATGASPIVDFQASNTTILTGQHVSFTDLSMNNPTSWTWSFPGGTPGSSTVQNPANIAYSTPGIYNVTLSAANTNGSNSLTKTGYIQVLNSVPTSATINSITVKQMPFPPPPPNWVNLYFKLTDLSSTVYYDGYNQVLTGINIADLPVSWTLTPPYSVTTINHIYKIELYAKKVSPPDLLINFVQFNLNNYTTGLNAYPTLINISGNGISLDIQVSWL